MYISLFYTIFTSNTTIVSQLSLLATQSSKPLTKWPLAILLWVGGIIVFLHIRLVNVTLVGEILFKVYGCISQKGLSLFKNNKNKMF